MFSVGLENLVIHGTKAGQSIALTASEAAYLRNKLGRVRNVSVDDPVDLPLLIYLGQASMPLKER